MASKVGSMLHQQMCCKATATHTRKAGERLKQEACAIPIDMTPELQALLLQWLVVEWAEQQVWLLRKGECSTIWRKMTAQNFKANK